MERNWFLVDANGKILGRMASKIATILMGKHKPTYVPYMDCGDYVVVINAKKVKLSGKKLQQKFEFRHSGYLGNPKFIPYSRLIEKNPERIIYLAVKGMLPKNKLRKKFLKKLKIFPESNHPYLLQKLEVLKI